MLGTRAPPQPALEEDEFIAASPPFHSQRQPTIFIYIHSIILENNLSVVATIDIIHGTGLETAHMST